jgi:hypothetical protein
MKLLRLSRRCLGRQSSAQALLEMALVVPLLALLLVGVFELGLILYAHVQVSNAAREAARAASLYRSTRYSTMDKSNPAVCDGTISVPGGGLSGWSLQQTVNEAIVYYQLGTNGCPDTTKPIAYTSLGWLDPKPASPGWSATITPAQLTTSQDATIPTAGDYVTIKLRYPYKLVVLSNFISYLSDPFWIEKSVKIQYQN